MNLRFTGINKRSYPEARAAGAALIAESKKSADRNYFIYVNNRLEGNALETIGAMLEVESMES